MKRLMLAMPAVALFAAAALAQTDTTTTTGVATGTDATAKAVAGATTDAAATGGAFGTNWPLSVGTTFFTDADSATLRSAEEISGGWQSLSQPDRDMITADCKTFMAAHGAGAEASASAAVDSGATTGTADGDADADAGAEAATTSAAGYDLAEMKAVCEAVDKL